MVNEGDKAPNIKLPDADEAIVRLSAFKGQHVVLYFYPKDLTPGCTTEALDFSRLQPKFAEQDAVILGISPDPPAKHRKFIEKHDLTIRLLSDEDKAAAVAFGVWVEKSMYGKKYMGVERATFVIDPKGIIKHIWRKVRVKGHADDVLAALSST